MRDAVILAVLGMGTVLILLFVINLMIVAIGKLFGPKETKKIENPKQGGAVSSPAAAAPVTPAASSKDEAIVAVLAAAVAAYLNTSPDRVRLVVRPIQTSAALAGTELILEKERKRLL